MYILMYICIETQAGRLGPLFDGAKALGEGMQHQFDDFWVGFMLKSVQLCSYVKLLNKDTGADDCARPSVTLTANSRTFRYLSSPVKA